MNKHVAFLIIAMVMCVFTIKAQPQWVSFFESHSQEPTISVIQSSNDSVTLSVEIPGLNREVIEYGGEIFDRLSLAGGIRGGLAGSPEIPFFKKLLAIPECEGAVISVSIKDSTILDHYYVYPIPNLVKDSSNGTVQLIESYFYDRDRYSHNMYIPKLIVEVDHYGYVRSQKVMTANVNPIRFNPVEHKLIAYQKMEITIKFKRPKSNINVNTGIFNNVVSHSLLNYKSNGVSAKSRKNRDETGNVTWVTLNNVAAASTIVADYLIITAQEYNVQNQNLALIANHRAQYNGYDVAVVSAQNIMSLPFYYTTQNFQYEQKIRSFIKMVYEGNHANHTYDGKLAYVLLVGDCSLYFMQSTNEGVPTSCDNTDIVYYPNPNDYYYACITNNNGVYDPEGDLFIGRLSVNNETELYNIIWKTIYDETGGTNEDWKFRTNLIDGMSDPFNRLYYDNCIVPNFTALTNPPYHTYFYGTLADDINNGTNTLLYIGHSTVTTLNSADIYWFDQYLDNLGEYPFFTAFSCMSGAYFDPSTDCIGEQLTTYSSSAGVVGYLAYNSWIALPSVDPCNTTPVYFYDYIYKSIYQNLSHITGEFILESKLEEPYDGKYAQFGFNLLGDPALNIMTNGFWVTKDLTLDCNTTISNTVYVMSGKTLTIPPNCNLYFDQGGWIKVLPGATLIIGDGATIHGKTSENEIYVGGTIRGSSSNSMIKDVNFISIDNAQSWKGLELCNTALSVVFDNCTFNNCGLVGNANSVNVSNNSTFNKSTISLTETNFELHHTALVNTNIILEKYNTNLYSAIIDNNCTFLNDQALNNDAVIKIIGYQTFNIKRCTLSYNNGTGIDLTNCGWGGSSNYISNCTIQKTSNPQYLSWGIRAYQSSANISNNFISQNRYGIACIHSSNISVAGNASATNVNQTQRIKDNYVNQIIAFDNSFPYYLHYNEIRNTINPNFYLIYYDNGSPIADPGPGITAPLTLFNVKCNCFPTPFNPNTMLYPSNQYEYSIWCPPSGTCDYRMSDDDYSKNANAKNILLDGIYPEIESDLTKIIKNDPNSNITRAALKKLFYCSKKSYSDYSSLKEFYLKEAALSLDSVTRNLNLFLTNKCNIEQKNYTKAIQWFNNKINTSGAKQDSIYSLIDLEYLSLQMKKESFQGNSNNSSSEEMSKSLASSQAEFRKNSDFLIRKLFDEDDSSNLNHNEYNHISSSFLLFQNHPNPFSGETNISYSLPCQTDVKIIVSDLTGKRLICVDKETQQAGSYEFTLNCGGLTRGCYLVSLYSNSKDVARIKMVIIK